ncbi:hypothetical protein HFP72_31960 [Nocardiopsis sp. ARC36]
MFVPGSAKPLHSPLERLASFLLSLHLMKGVTEVVPRRRLTVGVTQLREDVAGTGVSLDRLH